MTNDKATDLFKAMATKAGFTPDQVTLALSQPEWKEIENRDNRHSEYASALDRAKNLEPLANKAKEWDEWWTKKGGSKLYETQQTQAERLARYTERFGDLDPNASQQQVQQAAQGAGLTMQQVQALLDAKTNEMGVRMSSMTTDLGMIMVDAANRGIKLSTDDLAAMNKLMADKGVTYGAAYSEHLGPKVREMEEQRLDKEKKDYAAEQVRDALSRAGVHNLPSSSEIPANFYDRPKAGVAEKSLSDQELLGMWNDAAPGARTRAA